MQASRKDDCRLKEGGAAGGDRTHDPWLRRPILYPLSYSRIFHAIDRFHSQRGIIAWEAASQAKPLCASNVARLCRDKPQARQIGIH